MQEPSAEPVRVDKWLWAARLVKTRALGADAVKSGRVHVNGVAIKPSKDVRPGDRLELRFGAVRRELVVRATLERRGPASVAALLYDETPESAAAREAHAEQRRLNQPIHGDAGGRPTKRDRRRLDQARRAWPS
jgi:ribosome-associated heat shock protein Hsp15